MEGTTTTWWATAAAVLKERGVSDLVYVPDTMVDPLVRELEKVLGLRVVSATREEEALGICAGSFLGGGTPVAVMQSSGLGNTLNALGSLLIPYQIPVLLLISLRGDLGEWNVAQTPLGQATRPILTSLGIPHFDLAHASETAAVIGGAAELCFKTRQPVAVILRSTLARS